MPSNKRVIIVATSPKTCGGISSVIKAHRQGHQWNEFHCRWVRSHRDKGAIIKIFYMITGYLRFLWSLYTTNIVHVHFSEPSSAKRKWIFIRTAKLLGKKVIGHFHSFSADTTIRGKCSNLYYKIFRSADKVIVLSPLWKREVSETFPDLNNIEVIYNPCTVEPLPDKYERKKQILFAGTLNERKGYADLIRAFAMIADRFPDWKVVFAGNGEIKEGKNIAAELDIDHQTEFIGWVDGKEKDRVFKESSIFCLPSYAEGFPMAVLDAWAYGLPVVTTPVGGIPDIVSDGENALLFKPGDTAALANCLKRMISDQQLRDNIAASSKRLASTVFSVRNINEQIGELYRKL